MCDRGNKKLIGYALTITTSNNPSHCYHQPSTNSTASSPSSPSRYLLTFLLSSCHLVQVTCRLVAALAITSLLFVLVVHVLPGAYCSNVPSIYSQTTTSIADKNYDSYNNGNTNNVRWSSYNYYDTYIVHVRSPRSSNHDEIGTPVPRTICSYRILGASKRKGILISPNYPGVYPKDISCSYKYIGTEGQRIRLEFSDFDVFYGGAHCPYDEVNVYDGMDPRAPLIGTYCGQQRNLVLFSSSHHMFVTFNTIETSAESQNRGFKGVWEFAESFVKLDFIENNMGTHISGTECDQRILSRGQPAGVLYSPNYPFPYMPKIVCRYFIYGLQDAQNLERVRLSFEKFDVIANINSSEEYRSNQSEPKQCGDGFVKVYLKGQEVIQAEDQADYEFCGKEAPYDVVSDGPRLILVFSSGETVGSGFKARYQFETDYRVPGTAAPDGSCHFTYYSSSGIEGEFNSPRFPSKYPSTTNCTYIFFQQPNQQVEVWNVISDAEDRLVGRYCGSTAPGPIESLEVAVALKVILHTDDEGVSSGFKARYLYFTADTNFGGGLELFGDVNAVIATAVGVAVSLSLIVLLCAWGQRRMRRGRLDPPLDDL